MIRRHLVSVLLIATAASSVWAAEVDRREAQQQDRISQGVQSGQLTPKEAAHLERREAKVNEQIRQERAANGGKLTAAERAQINREQNRLSRDIYRKKHNGRVQ